MEAPVHSADASGGPGGDFLGDEPACSSGRCPTLAMPSVRSRPGCRRDLSDWPLERARRLLNRPSLVGGPLRVPVCAETLTFKTAAPAGDVVKGAFGRLSCRLHRVPLMERGCL